jgi:hypothetical protein
MVAFLFSVLFALPLCNAYFEQAYSNISLSLEYIEFKAQSIIDNHFQLLERIKSDSFTVSKHEESKSEPRFVRTSLSANIQLEDSTAFTCASFPEAYDPYLFCSGVVFYPFFLPNGMTINDLDKQVSQIANYYPPSILNTECLSSIKRDLCAAVFMPCVPNGKKTSLNLFNFLNHL